MRLPQRRPLSAQINMTPMIDVTFQLIIFFLLSSRLVLQEALDLDLPTAASSSQLVRDDRPRVSISVSPDGQVFFSSMPVPPEEIARLLRVERDRLGSDLEVRIRAGRLVPYGVIEPILLAASDAGIWNVTFAVFEKAESHD
jgi:biopolymer transport protein ExbD